MEEITGYDAIIECPVCNHKATFKMCTDATIKSLHEINWKQTVKDIINIDASDSYKLLKIEAEFDL